MEVHEDIEKSKDEALLLHSKVLLLKPPAANTLKGFKAEFEPKPGRTALRGESSRILDNKDDLVALRVPTDQNRLTKLVQLYCPWLFLVSILPMNDVMGHKELLIAIQTGPPNGRVVQTSERKIARFVAVVSTLLAALLLVGAMVALNYVRSHDRRLALIGIFTVFFAGSVGLLTAASRAEVFAATAAYAAVLVVFISGNQAGQG